MKFAPLIIRKIAVESVLSKKATPKEVAEIIGYSVQSIYNWIRIYHAEGRLEPLPNGHRPSCFTPDELVMLKELMDAGSDMTLEQIKEHFDKTCCLSAIHRLLEKLGYTYKKNSSGKRTGTRRRKKEACGVESFSE